MSRPSSLPLGTVLEHPCAECGGRLILSNKPPHWAGKSRLAYLCETSGCRGLLGAHPNGEALGLPADAETRRARRLTHELLDALWKGAVAVYRIQETGAAAERAKRAITGKARTRTYAWLAHQMGLSVDQCHIAMMDIEQLRIAWAHLRRATFHQIRDWAKEREG